MLISLITKISKANLGRCNTLAMNVGVIKPRKHLFISAVFRAGAVVQKYCDGRQSPGRWFKHTNGQVSSLLIVPLHKAFFI